MLRTSRKKSWNDCACSDTNDATRFDGGRRRFLANSAAATAFGVFGNLGTAISQTNPRRIDVHHHLSSPGFIREISSRKTGQALLEQWTPAKSIEDMDKGGVATSVVSIAEPGVHFGSDAAARALARECNEYGAKLKSDYRGRFGNFAIVPMPDVDGSLKEIGYALDTLKAEGICLMTSYQSKYLGDPMFTPIMDELNRRKAVVFVHPVRADCCRGLIPEVSEPTIELPQDTARTILSVVISGNAKRYPGIRFIFSHAGGTLPPLIHRIEGLANVRKDLMAERFPDGVRAEFRKFYYDTAISYYPWTLMPLMELVDTTQVMFGTDFPFRSARDTAQGIAKYTFTDADLAAIDRGNAIRLMPTLA